MQRLLKGVQIAAVAMTLTAAVGARAANAAPVFRECDENEWAIAECGFNTDCYNEFSYPECGYGAPDTCYVIGETIFYEGWCYPTTDCGGGGTVFC